MREQCEACEKKLMIEQLSILRKMILMRVSL